MGQITFKTAVLGLNEQGRLLLECAAASGLFQIEVVADKDIELAQKTAQEHGCRHYDDYRMAVMQTGVDVIFAAAPLHTCAEYIHAALSKKLHVIRIAPPARTCDELAGFVCQAADSDSKLAIVSSLRFNNAFASLCEYLHEANSENISLVTLQCGLGASQESWQRDPKLAGGGILLYNCYEMIDQLVFNFGLPDEVYAIGTSQAPDRQQRLSVTEDTAVVSMKYSDTLTINIIAGRTVKPQESILHAYGKDGVFSIDTNTFSIFDASNKLKKKITEPAKGPELISRFLDNFAQNILSPEKTLPLSQGQSHLKTMALIEAAYLSSRTGTPESPNRILAMSQNTMARYLFK